MGFTSNPCLPSCTLGTWSVSSSAILLLSSRNGTEMEIRTCMSSNLDHSLTLFDVLNCMYQHGLGHSFFKVIVYVIGNYKYAWKFQNERHPKLLTFIVKQNDSTTRRQVPFDTKGTSTTRNDADIFTSINAPNNLIELQHTNTSLTMIHSQHPTFSITTPLSTV